MKFSLFNKILNFDIENNDILKKANVKSHFKDFIIVFFITAINYSFFIFHHLLNNHAPRIPWGTNSEFYYGRWFHKIFNFFNINADIPVFNQLIATLILTFSAILLLKVLGKLKSNFSNYLILIFYTTFPFFLANFYVSYELPKLVLGPFFAICAVLILQNFKSNIYIIYSSIFILFAYSSYQPSVGSFLVLMFATLIISLSNREKLYFILIKTLRFSLSFFLGTIFYIVSLKLLNINTSLHSTETVDLYEFFDKFLEVIVSSFKHFYLTQPELNFTVKLLLLAFVLLSFLITIYRAEKKIFPIIVLLFFWFFLILSSKFLFFISTSNNYFNYRYNISLGLVYAFAIYISINFFNKGILKTILILLIIFINLRFIQSNLIKQEILYRAEDHDKFLNNRILSRIENMDLDFEKSYYLVKIGKSNFKTKLHKTKGYNYKSFGDTHVDFGEITDIWSPHSIMPFLGSKIKFKPLKNWKAMINEGKELMEQNKPWPSKESILIVEDIIYVKIK